MKEKTLISIYKTTMQMLPEMAKEAGLNEQQLDEYFHVQRYTELNRIYRGMVGSITNRNMIPKVIGDVDQYDKLLMGFDPKKVIERYGLNYELFLNELKIQRGLDETKVHKRSLWRMFAKGTISCAKFMEDFDNSDDFYRFGDIFAKSDIDKVAFALPMLLAKEIDGFGFALACDFLKGAGYDQYPKPDVHIMVVLKRTNCILSRDDYLSFKLIRTMAKLVGVSPYKADKAIWLVCSGTFYKQDKLIKSRKEELIKRVMEG